MSLLSPLPCCPSCHSAFHNPDLGEKGTEILPSISTGHAGNCLTLPGLGKEWISPVTPRNRGLAAWWPIKSVSGESSSISSSSYLRDPVTAETMALGVLCLGLTLLGVLQSWAQDSTQNLIPAPSLLKVPLQPGFQKDKVGTWKGNCRREQGKWGADGKRSQRLHGQHWVGWIKLWETRVRVRSRSPCVPVEATPCSALTVSPGELHWSTPPFLKPPLSV